VLCVVLFLGFGLLTGRALAAVTGVQGSGQGDLDFGNWVNVAPLAPGATETIELSSPIVSSSGASFWTACPRAGARCVSTPTG
jgi:hypothetical protein